MRLLFCISILLFFVSCKSKFQRAFEEFDKREYYLRSPFDTIGNVKEVELLSNAIIFKPKCIALYHYRAQEYELFQNFELALKDYDICIREDFGTASIYKARGICQMRLKNYPAAYLDFLEAEKLCKKEWEETPESMKKMSHWGNEYAHQELRLASIREQLEKAKMYIK